MSVVGNNKTNNDEENNKDGLVLEVENLSEATHVADLWAGYGSVQSLEAVVVVAEKNDTLGRRPSRGKQKQRQTLSCIAKLVQPNESDEDTTASESHVRKVQSYRVEAAFYRHVAPQIPKQCGAALLGIPQAYWIQTPASKEAATEAGSPSNIGFSEQSKSLLAQRLGVSSPKVSAFVFVLSDLGVDYPVDGSSMSRGLNLQQTQTALSWLAHFHSLFWRKQEHSSIVVPEGTVWEQGTYWYLATRQSEWRESLNEKDKCWRLLSHAAPALDQRLQQSVTTLLHGDFKQANLLFSTSGKSCAAVDFQYAGWGCGMKDVVMLLVSSVDPSVLAKQGEEGLLRWYLARLEEHLHPSKYPWLVALAHYELSLLDYVRFLSGWGWWGMNHASYAKPRARRLLQELQTEREKLIHGGITNDDDEEEEAWRVVVEKRFAVTACL